MSSNNDNPKAALTGLDSWRQLAIAAAMVERMRPNFELFCEVSGHAGSEVFANILQLIREYAAGEGAAVDFDKQQAKLDLLVPDPQRYDMYGVWPALDACAALTALVSCCQAFDPDECDSVFSVSEATIAGFIEASGGEQDDIPRHPLMAAEREVVDSLVKLVCSSDLPRRQLVAALRDRVLGQSNIGLTAE